PDAGDLQVRPHRHRAGRLRRGALPGDGRASALSQRSRRAGHQYPRRLFRPVEAPVSAMPFGLNEAHLFYIFAAISVVLVAEAIYLLFFSATSYRSRVNRRLRLMSDQADRQAILVQLRRERGLTGGGDYRLPLVFLNRLILQSGLSLGVTKFAILVAVGAVAAFGVSLFFHFSLVEALLIAAASTVVLPFAVLF